MNGAALAVRPEVAEGLPARTHPHLKETGPHCEIVLDQIVVEPIQRAPVVFLADRILRVEPAHIPHPILVVLEHPGQSGFGDDGFVAASRALAQTVDNRAVAARAGKDARGRVRAHRRPAIFVEAQISVRGQGLREEVGVVGCAAKVARAKVEGHRLHPLLHQFAAKGCLKFVIGPQSSLDLGPFCRAVAIRAGRRAGDALVQAHPGVHQQTAIFTFAGCQLKIVGQNVLGEFPPPGRRVWPVQPAIDQCLIHRLLATALADIVHTPHHKGIRGAETANVLEQALVPGVHKDHRRLNIRNVVVGSLTILDVKTEFVHKNSCKDKSARASGEGGVQ